MKRFNKSLLAFVALSPPLRPLCNTPHPSRYARHRLAAARSRSGSDTPPACHSLPSRRFATSQREADKAVAPAQVYYEGSRGAEISQVKAEGMRSAEGVLMYVEGVRMPTTKKVKGHQTVAFYGCGIYAREIIRLRPPAQPAPTPPAPSQANSTCLSFRSARGGCLAQ